MTFSFIISLIFCFGIFIILAVLLAVSVYQYYKPRKSKYSQYYDQTQNFPTDLTVIYRASGTLQAAREQISAIISLIQENYPQDFTFQLIVFISPNLSNEAKNALTKPFESDSRISWIEMEIDILQTFMCGCARATGKVIVEAKYLAIEIASVKDRQPEFIDFQERNVETIFHTPNKYNYLIPIAISKISAEKLFPRMPFIQYGYSKLLYNLANQQNTSVRIISSRYEPVMTSPIEILLTELFTLIFKV